MFNSSTFYENYRILYIEKNINSSKFFLNLLEKMFKEVYYFNNSSLALTFFEKEENKIDIIVSDVELEKNKTGLEILKKIRTKKNTPFILIGEEYDSEVLLFAIKYGITDFIKKPITSKKFLDTLESVFKNNIYFETKKETKKDLQEIVKVVNEVALVFKTNTKNELTYINKSFSKILAYDEADIIKNIIFFINKEKTCLDTILKKIMSGKVWEGKSSFISKNKKEYYVYLTVIPSFKQNDNKIDEVTWISFLANEYEIEQKNFRKKVMQSINANRRINTEARKKIDELQNKLVNFENLDLVYNEEKNKKDKFQSQFDYFDKEAKANKKKLDEIKEKAKVKLKSILKEQQVAEVRKEKVSFTLDLVNSELELKNKTIDELNNELEKQELLIEQLILDIEHRELELGLNQ